MSDKKDIQKIEEELIEVKEEAAKNLAGWQRAQADYSNLQKEQEKKAREIVEFANASFMAEVLPVYSHLKLAVDHIPEDQKEHDWVKGIIQIKKQFQEFFKKYKITEVETVGQKFDHNLHEAVAHEEKEGFETDTIFEEVSPGYKLDDRVINHAKVKVAK